MKLTLKYNQYMYSHNKHHNSLYRDLDNGRDHYNANALSPKRDSKSCDQTTPSPMGRRSKLYAQSNLPHQQRPHHHHHQHPQHPQHHHYDSMASPSNRRGASLPHNASLAGWDPPVPIAPDPLTTPSSPSAACDNILFVSPAGRHIRTSTPTLVTPVGPTSDPTARRNRYLDHAVSLPYPATTSTSPATMPPSPTSPIDSARVSGVRIFPALRRDEEADGDDAAGGLSTINGDDVDNVS